MTVPTTPPVAVFYGLPAHTGSIAFGGLDITDPPHLADLVIYPDCVLAVFRRWGSRKPEDGMVIRQDAGPLRVRYGGFRLPWLGTVVWVRSGPQLAMLRMPRWRRAQLGKALERAGFPIDEARTRFGYGKSYNQPAS